MCLSASTCAQNAHGPDAHLPEERSVLGKRSAVCRAFESLAIMLYIYIYNMYLLTIGILNVLCW